MSGGSLDYVYGQVQDIADRIRGLARKPLHHAFADHLELCAKALHDLEWLFSCDYSDGDEEPAIRAVVSPAAEASTAVETIKRAIADAQAALARLEGD